MFNSGYNGIKSFFKVALLLGVFYFAFGCSMFYNSKPQENGFDLENEFKKNIESSNYPAALLNYDAMRNTYGATKNDCYNMSFLAKLANNSKLYSYWMEKSKLEEKSMFNDCFIELLDNKTRRAFLLYSNGIFIQESDVSDFIISSDSLEFTVIKRAKTVEVNKNGAPQDSACKICFKLTRNQKDILKLPEELNLFIIDYYMIAKYNYQVFGTISKFNFINGKYEMDRVLFPVIQTRFGDSLRRKVGLGKLN